MVHEIKINKRGFTDIKLDGKLNYVLVTSGKPHTSGKESEIDFQSSKKIDVRREYIKDQKLYGLIVTVKK